ncbi:MAG: DNA polymerase IV 2 [Cyclobacteriaceae bacterium]|nr:MAG: DNA polymerase IV 2 [Cyclobacteriaceae bacterium]
MRKIIHIDMDAFYASVEQRDFPELRGKPIAVGGNRERGVVMTASYEARKFGVRSAMPSAIAYRLCPDLIFAKPRFQVYRQVSEQIRTIFYRYTDLVEPLSLDEAYLDVTENKMGISSASQIAREIKKGIVQDTGITASAGVSINKFLAKVASDYKKPNGLSVIMPHQVAGFIDNLEISRFHGIGKVTTGKMHELGIKTGADLKSYSEQQLVKIFGKNGRNYYLKAHGKDTNPVNPHRLRKSISSENTFSQDLTENLSIQTEVMQIARQVMDWMNRHQVYGRTVTLKVKFNDFNQITRSKTLGHYIRKLEELEKIAAELQSSVNDPRPVRLLGLSMSNLNNQDAGESTSQLTLDF